MKTFFLLITLKIFAFLVLNFLGGFIAIYVLQILAPNLILSNLDGFFFKLSIINFSYNILY